MNDDWSIEVTNNVFDFLVERYNPAVLRLGSDSGDDISFHVVASRFSESVYPIDAEDISIERLIYLCTIYVRDNCLNEGDVDLLNDMIRAGEVVVFDRSGEMIRHLGYNLILASKIKVFAKVDDVLSTMLRPH